MAVPDKIFDKEEEPKKKTGWRGPPGSINTKGRPVKSPDEVLVKPTNKELKNRELLLLLRKLKPHVADAVMTAVTVMQKSDSDQNKLKASQMILQNFHKLTLDLYSGADVDANDDGEEIQKKSGPVFSLKMLPDNEGEAEEVAKIEVPEELEED